MKSSSPTRAERGRRSPLLSTLPLQVELFGRNPKPYTLRPTHDTLQPTPDTVHRAPYTLHPTLYALHPTLYALRPNAGA